MARCDICSGQRKVRLPVYHPLSPACEASLSPTSETRKNYREFPCPQCSDYAPLDRVMAVSTHCDIMSGIDGEDFIRPAHESLAHNLVDVLLNRGFIQFERGPENRKNATFPMYATLGVVAPKIVETIEERISERQGVLAKEVAVAAAELISIWGSHYHGDEGSIYKSQAIKSVNDALSFVLQNQISKRKMNKP